MLLTVIESALELSQRSIYSSSKPVRKTTISHDSFIVGFIYGCKRKRMLSTKILKLRLSRIAKGKEHLSTQGKLMLVSMESPDLSANFFLRLFKVSLPKQWKFQHQTDEDILYTSQLIKLIENQ